MKAVETSAFIGNWQGALIGKVPAHLQKTCFQITLISRGAGYQRSLPLEKKTKPSLRSEVESTDDHRWATTG